MQADAYSADFAVRADAFRPSLAGPEWEIGYYVPSVSCGAKTEIRLALTTKWI